MDWAVEQWTQWDAWYQKLFRSFYAVVANPDLWLHILTVGIKIVAILVGTHLAVRLARTVIERLVEQRDKGRIALNERRVRTMTSLATNIVTYTLYFLALLLVLGQLGFNLAPILAGAGVVGLAVGLGAQNLVRDVITGFFIIFEDQFAVGDVIQVGQYKGTVIEIGLRVTKIRSWTGEVHIIPNGRITEVTNFSVANALAVVDVGVAYDTDVDKAMRVLREEILEEVQRELPDLVAKPEVLGVEQFRASGMVLRVVAECKPNTQFAVARTLRQRIKEGFDRHGIEIPYPQMVMVQPTSPQA
ncbi:mechanosensitive ion channel family protein [Calditerricola satsumensis]|uniref:Mechanosensitive ion channel protein MscS n=1 Tax=Calditerricola satsumensis TaxID=373054 RepID=A0A8J3F9J0_9BACI|nr:mechanosensitive ion channel family protein [Calditerricola satsumensis]GGJ97224.1 mechanosensitive ion channel protein MscS [Calditerricola satsumensis]